MIRVFTTRPDTLFGATYMVLAPEHPLVDRLTTPEQREAVAAYRAGRRAKSDLDRTDLAKTKTGVFTGGYAINPVNGKRDPRLDRRLRADGLRHRRDHGRPGHDERDFEFAKKFDLPIVRVVAPSVDDASKPLDEAETDAGVAVNSRNADVSLDGLATAEAKALITGYLEAIGRGKKTINYKLRDWLFSRQRYWGEPFPILLGRRRIGRAASRESRAARLLCPTWTTSSRSGRPEPPLGKATEWVNVLRRQATAARRTRCRSGPARAGTTCATSTRRTTSSPGDPEKEKYWLPVDLYVGGAEHAVLHLLYSRFWHKVLFDRGHVHTPEPFQKLVNQGMILGEMEYTGFRRDGSWVSPAIDAVDGPRDRSRIEPKSEVVKKGDGFVLDDRPDGRRSTPAPTRCRRAAATSSTRTRSSTNTAPTASASTRCSWARWRR